MKFSTITALASLAGLTLAAPIEQRDPSRGNGSGKSKFSQSDITILQFALTLEHLENTFYQEAFNTFKLQDFINAGFSEEFFVNLQFIAFDEATHVQILQAAISSAGVIPVLPCSYHFPVTDVASFVTLSAVLESIGTSAYLGAAGFVGSKDILTIAASIMATEGLHTALQRSSLGAIGAPDPFFTPLDPNSVFTLAAQFITACPPSNPPLPFTAFPSLTIDAQQCFDEVGSFGASQVEAAVSATETTTADYATRTWADSTDTTVADIAAISTTDTASATETAAASSSSTTTTTTESAAAETTAPPAMKLRVRQEEANASTTDSAALSSTTTTSSDGAVASATEVSVASVSSGASCSVISSGSILKLSPDFKSSRHDFSRVTEIFVTFVEGLNVISVAVGINSGVIGGGGFGVPIPSGIGGQVFVFITVVDISGRTLKDSDVLFGPGIVEGQLPSFFAR
ncbi:hypothetical protein PV08_10531 [Exophiala spinifera]|uniref:Protein rds1 n=1 Tax=Exophiala spinifera TaxID=91928 RepID=A0A0D1Y8B5_9EURO|nr:uncharacterized protein PV08_10531 [Exophiala spinifera]KIW11231.1 hypothetical protein PV08_10531 [Exophiala spinifera]